MLKRIQRGFDHIKSSKTTARCQVKIEIQKLEDLPQTIKQVRVVWAKSVGKGIKASTDSCVVHSGNRLEAISKLLHAIAYPCRNSLCPFTTACGHLQGKRKLARLCSTSPSFSETPNHQENIWKRSAISSWSFFLIQ